MKLIGASSAEEIERAMKALCQPFGGVNAIALFPDRHRRLYVCYVELNSRSLHPAMMEALGGTACGNSVAFEIPFQQAANQARRGA